MIVNWFMNLINEFIFVLIFPGILLGVAAIVGSKFIPNLLPQYKLPLQIGGLILTLFFVFQAGRQWEYDKNKTKEDAEKALAVKRSRDADKVSANTKTSYAGKINNVEKLKNEKTDLYVSKESDNMCTISNSTSSSIAKLLNSSAGWVPNTTKRVNGTTK